MHTRPPCCRRRAAAALLALTIAGLAATAPASPHDAQAAIPADEPALPSRLGSAGFTAEQVQRMLQLLASARGAGLPVDSLLSRINEGLAKQAPPEALESAIRIRLSRLESARSLLGSADYTDSTAEPWRQLLTATALALESGLPAEDLGQLLARGKGRFTMRMASVIEASESLHLVGIGRETVLALATDCLDRSLGRMEILRVVSYCSEQHRTGAGDAAIRNTLWGAQASTNHIGRGPGGPRGGPGYGGGGR